MLVLTKSVLAAEYINLSVKKQSEVHLKFLKSISDKYLPN